MWLLENLWVQELNNVNLNFGVSLSPNSILTININDNGD